MTTGTCYVCNGRPPICDACFDEMRERWRDSARMFGFRWGAGLRISLDHGGQVLKSWPPWESERAMNVRRICRRIVEPLASTVPDRRDARLVEAFARICASAAEESFTTLALDEARMIVADFDRRFPAWSAAVARRVRGNAQ